MSFAALRMPPVVLRSHEQRDWLNWLSISQPNYWLDGLDRLRFFAVKEAKGLKCGGCGTGCWGRSTSCSKASDCCTGLQCVPNPQGLGPRSAGLERTCEVRFHRRARLGQLQVPPAGEQCASDPHNPYPLSTLSSAILSHNHALRVFGRSRASLSSLPHVIHAFHPCLSH